MKLARKPDPQGSSLAGDAGAIVQIKIWLLGVSPMVWRRVQVSADITLRELHGVIQVAMGWEGIHLYQFSLRATRFGSAELSASSPSVTLAARRG
jgi:Plasmid pRiA4b ORF-3-like protein